MKLYHYTSCEHLQRILEDREIKLTASNLMKPVRPYVYNGSCCDVTDSYKPVVWFTTLLDFKRAQDCGLIGSSQDKTAAVIVVEATPEKFRRWDSWAEENSIDDEWYSILKSVSPEWNTFYITEEPVRITEATQIIFRPDVMQVLKLNGEAINSETTTE